MKLKTRIISTIMSMSLALAVMGFAVYAAATQTLTVSNTVNFVSNHVLATVVGVVTGAEEGTYSNYSSHTTTANDEEGALGSWQVGSNMRFALETAPIYLTITVTNNSLERALSFELVQTAYSAWNGSNLDETNITRAVTYSITNDTPVVNEGYASGEFQVEATRVATIVIRLDIFNTGMSVTEFDNSFTFILRNIGNGSGQNFVFNPALKTLWIPQGKAVEYDNLPQMTVDGNPAFYGLFTSENYLKEEKVEDGFVASEDTTLFASFNAIPEELEFTQIGESEEYSVKTKDGYFPSGDLFIPETVNGWPITKIDNYAFYYNGSLTAIVLPSGIKIIGNEALSGNTSVTEYILPEGLQEIGNSAFLWSNSISTIRIPSTVNSIGASAFAACASLLEIVVDESNANYSSENGVLFNKDKTVLYTFPAGSEIVGYTVPATVGVIDAGAFSQAWRVESVVLPEGLIEIKSGTFNMCSALTDVTIPSSVTSMGVAAFTSCTSLQTLSIPSSVTSIGFFAFAFCSNLTSITLPSIPEIGNYFFQNCSSLAEIVIPASVTTIGVRAFDGCLALSKVTILGDVTTVDAEAFEFCEGISTVFVESSIVAAGFITSASFGKVLHYMQSGDKVYVLSSISTFGDYLETEFGMNVETVELDGKTYWEFVKN